MTWKPDICIYHGNCPDGFGGAWAVRNQWPDCSFVAGIYGKAPSIDISKMHVLLVDFSYKYDDLVEMSYQASSLVVIDHHKSAKSDLAQLPSFDGTAINMEQTFKANAASDVPPIACWFDMDQSGATMAWKFANPDMPVPQLLLTIEDRDLWKFERRSTRELSALIASHPQDFDTWSKLIECAEYPVENALMATEGEAILRKHDKDVLAMIQSGKRIMTIGGVEVPVANIPYQFASDAAGLMATNAPFAAVYYDRWDGRRSFSLRSRGEHGLDVSKIAQGYGGGGHRNASGFAAPQGWEGDEGTIQFKNPA